MEYHILASGSKGNSIFIYDQGNGLLIDCGISKRQLYTKLNQLRFHESDIHHVLLTHDHIDHNKNISIFDQSIVYCGKGCIPGIDESHELENYQNIQLDHYIITPLPLSHDATSPLGFVIKGKDETILYMTDTGYVSQKNMGYMKNLDYYIFESNHDIELLMSTRRPLFLKNRILGDKGHLNNEYSAHVMAQAVKHLYPHAKFWVGPVVKEGFYYDIDLGDNVINDDAIEAIEKEMKKICKEGKKIYRREVSKEEALEMFKDDMYKLDLISGLEDGNITVYDQGDFTDLCRGPHVDNTKLCKNFKLVKYSGVYWKGDASNHVMQRIYGVCFPTAEELEEHLKLLEEAKERDHRKIGKEMELFMSDDLIGRGLPMFLPKGYTVWQELENYIKDKERKLGYLHVMTPCVGTVNLYKTSGHWDHYKENMFPAMEVEGESFVLRPMNCPHHMMIYANKMHSYKDLPIRIGEIAHDFRFEASGTLKGIERGRHFCQNDAHLFVTPEQIESEFAKVVDLIFETYKDFNITDYRCVLSLRDPEDKVKYHDDDEMWNNAENALRKVLNDIGIEYTEEIGEAAFYGPKLDVNVKPAIGNEYTLSTCQLDFCLPSKFNLTYIDKDGQRKTPVVLHRAILGSLDRFMAYILEETKGNLPLWLAPVQAIILPVKNEDEELNAYAHGLYDYLADNGIRVEIDERAEKLGYRVREAQVKKIPYLIVLGKNEAADGTVSYRLHGEQKSTTVSKDEFVAMLKDEIATKKNNPAAAK